ncbi:hypothetical protein N7481_010835 [Penicillium waksmanii]|uniref:uncharacterized protein n=1 Tax=Penicillium waksmanii TaxID=69791 RepID=UPI0025493D9E|nr:uncharacterized protein N7481_010835 [Penicillium waksmanii]KAJ5973625.1 hypothetical protein N7481_010835 [Penicillium waksmanii]
MGEPSEPVVQETTPFSLAMEVEEDIEQEIESFVRFKRRGEYLQAQELFQQTLSSHLTLFPVIAEYADLLLEQGKFRTLSEFLDIQIQYMESMLEEEEVELLCIMRSLVGIYTMGALRPALEQAEITWSFLCRRRFEVSPGTLPGDVEIHIFEVYMKILVFAFTTSNWVGINDMKCPWVHHSHGRCEFVRWYAMLLENGQLWNASNILVILLKLLPSLETQDVAILFRENPFGDVRNFKHLVKWSETKNLLTFTASFNRAQALLDLTLGLYRQRDDDDYEKLYEIALAYHLIAEDLVGIIFSDGSLGLGNARYTIQRMAFKQASKIFHKKVPTNYRTVDLQHFSQNLLRQDMQCYIISQLRLLFDRLTVSSNPYISYDLKTLLDIQLHTQGDFTGFIRTYDLSMPAFAKMLGAKMEHANQKTSKTFDIPLYQWAIYRSSQDLNSMLRERGILEEKLPLYKEISPQKSRQNLPVIEWDLKKIAMFAKLISDKQPAPDPGVSILGAQSVTLERKALLEQELAEAKEELDRLKQERDRWWREH